jgi:hypothetical protein
MQKHQSNKINYLNQFWIFFFPIASYLGYRYIGFNTQITKAMYFAILPLTIIFVFPELKKIYKHSLYASYVQAIFLLLLVSMGMAYIFWNQGILLSYRVTASYMAIVYYFLLLKVRPNILSVEKIIWFFCILYLILWGYGMIKAPQVIFSVDAEKILNDQRGFFRLSIPGKAIIILSFFMGISKFVETKKKKWIIISSLLFMVIVMHVTRQIIFFSFIVALYYLLKKNKFLWGWLVLAGIILFSAQSVQINEESAIGKMIALSNKQLEQQHTGEENTRITEYKYFFSQYSKNLLTDIFGNGVAHTESAFGKREMDLGIDKRLFASDVGYAAIFIRFGIIGLILYGLIFYTIWRQKVDPKYMYAKLFMIYLFFANIAASWIFQDVIIICFCLYILDLNTIERQYKIYKSLI